MKKTLKVVGIFAAILVVAVAAVVAGWVLIQNNKTYYINDLRIVEPIADASSYIYTKEGEYQSVKNQKVYMTSEEENFKEIAIYANISIKTTKFDIVSSNTDVAKIIIKNKKCYVNYVGAGEATITISHGGVSDSFDVYVYDQVSADFSVYDYKYYGEYASYFPNHIIGYSDSITYRYDYLAFSAGGEDAGDLLNNNLLRIDSSKTNTDVFESVSIDAVNKQLVLTCKAGLEANIDEQIAIQSYTITDEGISVTNNFVVNVHIVAYTPEFLQVVVSKSPNFEDGYVYMNTEIIDDSTLTEERILEDKSILDNYLSYKKAENNLAATNEFATYDLMFTDKVDTLYLKFRKVYTNGDMVYLDATNEGELFALVADTAYLKIQPTQDYYKLVLTKDYFTPTNPTFDIGITLLDYDLSFTFKIDYAELNADNLELFYDYDAETGIYTYKYWDPRSKYNNQVFDEDGNVIDIKGI